VGLKYNTVSLNQGGKDTVDFCFQK
jgi:hypothetical protein